MFYEKPPSSFQRECTEDTLGMLQISENKLMTGRMTRGAERSKWINTDRDRNVAGQEHLFAVPEFTLLNPAINNSVPDGIWPGHSMPARVTYKINQLLL